MGLKPGTILEINIYEGKIIAVKKQVINVFAKWRGKGKLPNGLSVDEYLKKARE